MIDQAYDPCPHCGDWLNTTDLPAHLAADHGDLTPPNKIPRRHLTVPRRTAEDLEADRASDRLDRINESRLP